MNKRIRCRIMVGIAVLCLSGCASLDPEDQYYEYQAPREKLQTVESLDLKPADMPASPQQKAEPNTPAAPAEWRVSIEECRAETLKNNLELQVQLYAPTAAQAAVDAEEAKFEAAFVANTAVSRTDYPGRLVEVGDGSYVGSGGSQYRNIDTGVGVQMPLQTGGTIQFNLADSRDKNLQSASMFSPWYETGFTFSISQPLLKNAGTRANMHSIRLARYDKQITDNATKLEVIRVLAAADRAYWRLYAARRQLEVRQKQYELAQAQLDRAKRLVAAGQQADVEILRAEAGLASQLASIIAAENELRLRQREFKRTLGKPGVDIETPTVVIPQTEADPVYYELDKQKLIVLAEQNRAELLDLELQIASRISTIDYLNNQMLPLVTLDYRYNVPGIGVTRDDAYDMLNEKNYENHRIGVSLWVPLGNEAAKNRLRQAMILKRQTLASKESRKLLIKQEVLGAVDQVETNWQQIMASRQNAILEGRVYEAEIRQFEQGLRTSTDVLDALTRLAVAQSSEIQALTDYQISLVDLAYATGTLLGAGKIQWEPITPVLPVN
ncbi:TolC family protein [Anaerohalosphaeraceae bacterium U12dextr]